MNLIKMMKNLTLEEKKDFLREVDNIFKEALGKSLFTNIEEALKKEDN